MKAEIITIGDEILIGQIVDTNSAWIAQKLNEAGFTVQRKFSIGDSEGKIRQAVAEGMGNADIVITTGGLGPTKDDITKTTLAEIFGGEMVRDEAMYRRNEQALAIRGVEYTDLNKAQSMVPSPCTPLFNEHGTAPGLWFERGAKVLIALPGVPFEMKELMKSEVMPRLNSHFNRSNVVHKTAITYGMAESILSDTIEDWEDALPEYLHLAYLPSPSQIRLRLSAYDVDAEMATQEIERQFSALEKLIPNYFIGYGDDTLASVTGDMLRIMGATLSVAESCTGGALSAKFTAIAGASDYFAGSVVSYSNDVKANVLGVSRKTLGLYGAVSGQVAEQMAEGVRRICGTNYALATTGIAGPSGGNDENPVGTVWIGLATPEKTVSKKFVYSKLREQNIERFAATAINMLRLELFEKRQATQKHK